MRRRLAAGAAALLLSAQYFAAEAIAAAAWTRPYSYSRNYISDLGVTRCIPTGPCSPLGAVMNTGFVMSGVLAIAAAALLLPLVPQRAGKRAPILILAVVHGIGSIGVGLVSSAPGTAAGTPHIHVLAAYAAIVGGNLAVIAAALWLPRAVASRWFRAVSLALGLVGLGSGLALVLTRGLPPGLLERGAVDTITLWQILAGACLAASLLRRSAAIHDRLAA